MSKKNGVLSVRAIKAQYKHDDVEGLVMSRRAAHFLAWAALNFPRQFAPWNWIYQASAGLKKTPRNEDKVVELLRKSASRIRRILKKDYHMDLTTIPGHARACADSEDILKTEMVRHSKRIQAEISAAQSTADLIHPSKIPNTAENVAWKHWFSKSLRRTLSDLSSEATLRKLEAPKIDPEE